MDLFLFIVVTIILFYRIKSTPQSLSKRLWENEFKIGINKTKSVKEKFDDEEWNVFRVIVFIFTLLLYIVFILIYVLVSNTLNSKYIFILSALQIVTVLFNIKELLSMKDVVDTQHQKFRRFWNLFNVILDYIYYPVVMIMLIM